MMSIAGTGGMRTRFSSIYRTVFVMIVAAIIFDALSFILVDPQARVNLGIFLSTLYVLPVAFILNLNTISVERAWLSFQAVGIEKYIQWLILSKIAQAVLIFMPLSLSDLFLTILGFKFAFSAFLIYLAIFPLFQVVMIWYNMATKKLQILDEFAVPERRIGLRILGMMGFIVSFITLIFTLVVLPFVAYALVPVLFAVSVLLIRWKSFWIARMHSLVDFGFI